MRLGSTIRVTVDLGLGVFVVWCCMDDGPHGWPCQAQSRAWRRVARLAGAALCFLSTLSRLLFRFRSKGSGSHTLVISLSFVIFYVLDEDVCMDVLLCVSLGCACVALRSPGRSSQDLIRHINIKAFSEAPLPSPREMTARGDEIF